ncbi:hypothetical protein [Paraburkholderia acidisoli]|uniref:hypothetical protein n=1 Tax=Paraburkholderia acidisoli TaxID=2571748 RepID=UPI0018EF13FF|nr:hypothetical protein [Paraburkholderia acidisoli]
MKFTRAAGLACALALAGCASITNGSRQMISLQAVDAYGTVPGANCMLTNSKGTWYARTPAFVTVHRDYGRLIVRCEKAGYDSGLLTAKSYTKGTVFGNLFAGGVIGAGVDIGDGSAYNYPQFITVPMTPKNVDAMLPQAGDPVSVPGDGGEIAVSGLRK